MSSVVGVEQFLVNFITYHKKGVGPYHRTLMNTEYFGYLKNLEIARIPEIFKEGQVVTVVCKQSDMKRSTLDEIKNSLLELRKYCETSNIMNIIVPLHIWARDGYDIEFLTAVVVSSFKNSPVSVSIG